MKSAVTPKAVVSSSPARAEKLPAPGLARLLRGKSGSRSRARSNPMFVTRSKSAGRSSSSLEPPLVEGGEPSSPKVTCIGQVRIRKKNKNRSSTKASPKSNRSDPSLGCRCLERSLLCTIFPRRKNEKKKKPTCYCCSPYRFFFCWRSKQKSAGEPAAAEAEAAPPIAFVREIKVETESEEAEEDEEDEETRVFVSSSSAGATGTTHSPPKNALLLMRCRSAPHKRSSALALCRFPVSPIRASEIEEEEVKGEGIEERGRDSCNLSSKDEEEEGRCSSTSQRQLQQSPAVGLMRCNSEPAKKAEKLMEVSYSELNGSGGGSREGGLGMVQEVGPTPSPHPILLH